MSATRRQASLDLLQSQGRLPSIVGGVLRGRELVWSGGSGEVAGGDPSDVQYRIGSITKTLVAVAVLRLRDEGLLSLDDPIGSVIPETGCRDVTVRQLLTMDAGLPQDDPWADRNMAEPSDWVSEQLFARGATRSRAPGTHFEYSNYGWAALGRVVSSVTGQRFQDVVRERVLDPLELTSTVWSAGDLPATQIATGYRGLHRRGAAERRRRLRGARRALLERARPRALERRVPERRAAPRRRRDRTGEPRDPA